MLQQQNDENVPGKESHACRKDSRTDQIWRPFWDKHSDM